jgi:hypothetical protein
MNLKELNKIEKELKILRKSIQDVVEKSSFSDRIKAGIVGASTMLVPSMRTENPTNQPKTEMQAPKTETQTPKKQNYFFPPDSEYSFHEQKNPLKTLNPQDKKIMENHPLKPGQILHDYRDPRHIPEEEAMEKKFGIPHRMITAIRVAGELSNWNESSKFNTRTPYQFRESSRNAFWKRDKVDAYKDTKSAIHATALHLKDNINRINNWKKNNDPRVAGMADTEEEKWLLAARLFNGSLEAVRSDNKENSDYGHRIQYGLKILQNNPDVHHLDSIIQEKRKQK